jgi:hypothetical protein
MEWISINSGAPDMRRYHLVKDQGIQMVLKYNLLQQSIRISCGGRHQVFFMESASNWNNRMLFKNVYGIEVGKFTFSNRHHSGRIEIEQVSLQCKVMEKDRLTVSLYETNKQQPVMSCHLPEGIKEQTVQIDNLERACLFLGLCVYCSLFFNNPTAQYQF